MASIRVSIRLQSEELADLQSLVERSGLSQSALVRSLLLPGMSERRFEEAVTAYRGHYATLSRAAEMAGLSLRDFLIRMEKECLEMHHGLEDFEANLASLAII